MTIIVQQEQAIIYADIGPQQMKSKTQFRIQDDDKVEYAALVHHDLPPIKKDNKPPCHDIGKLDHK